MSPIELYACADVFLWNVSPSPCGTVWVLSLVLWEDSANNFGRPGLAEGKLTFEMACGGDLLQPWVEQASPHHAFTILYSQQAKDKDPNNHVDRKFHNREQRETSSLGMWLEGDRACLAKLNSLRSVSVKKEEEEKEEEKQQKHTENKSRSENVF